MSLMHFKSIEIEQFRQFRDKVIVQDLAAGLNVIAGANEAGKSTLLQAIRAALFDRHASTAGDKYAPYNAKVSPRVKLIFDVNGVEYQLNKVFSKKRDGETTLKASDGNSWQGQAAEAQLTDLLAFSYAKKGQSKAEHQGLAGLLWVEQAKAYESVTLSDQSRQQIHAVFENEMRELLGGGQGEQLHKRIIQLRSEYFDARGNPRGDYKRFQGQAMALQQELMDKQQELKTYEDKVDKLEKRQTEFADYQQDKTLENALRQLESCKQVMANLDILQSQVESVAEKLKLTEADKKVAGIAWKSRTKLVAELADSQKKTETLLAIVKTREAELAPYSADLATLQSELSEFKMHKDQVDTGMRRARDIETLGQLSGESVRLESVLKDARKADTGRRRCILERDAIQLTDALMHKLREIDRTRELAEERLNAVATRIEHRLDKGVSVRLEDEILSGEGALQLTRTSKLEIQGVGHFTILPGGEDLQALQRKLHEHNRSLNHKLQDIGADSVTAAEEALRHSKNLDAQAEQYKATINALASDGLSALEDSYHSVVSRHEKLLANLGDVSPEEKRADDLQAETKMLQQQIGLAEKEIDVLDISVRKLREDLAGAKADVKTSDRGMGSLTTELEKERQISSDDSLEKKLTKSEAIVDETQRKLNAARQTLDTENPEIAESELERAQHARDDIANDIQKLEREIRDLKVELTALGQKGLAEEVATLKSEHANVKLQLEQTEHRAKALDLLQRTLDAALQQAKKAVAQPITDKLMPYLKQLIPEAAPLVNEELILTGIQRNGADEAFSDLSIGTREQLAVLVRLAYADLLSAEGVPVMVILDDALVNSDDNRRDRMKAILYQAAKRYQILLLTCHEKAYRDSGGKLIRFD